MSSRGLGFDKKSVEVISAEQEVIIWCKGILGRDTPQKRLGNCYFNEGYILLSALAKNIEMSESVKTAILQCVRS